MKDYKQVFEQKLFNMFPDVCNTGQVTRSQICDTMKALKSEKWPNWILENRVSRGVYSITPNVQPITIEQNKPAPVAEKKVSIKSASLDIDVQSLIPTKDHNYVPFGNYKDLEAIVKSGIWFPTYISGPTGNGKSTMIEQIHAVAKKPLIRINLNATTDEEQLIGSKTLVDGNIEIVDGPVIIAMSLGIPLLLDEIDAGSANALLCLQPILEGKPYYYKLKNKMIYPAQGFNIYATANTKGKGSEDGRYVGTNILNEAFLERFSVTFNQEYPSAASEKKIVLNIMSEHGCVDQDFAEDLVKWADAIRRTYESGGIDELITTRRLIHIIKSFKIFKNRKKAVELCCNRFDDMTKGAFIDLFDKISTEENTEIVQAASI